MSEEFFLPIFNFMINQMLGDEKSEAAGTQTFAGDDPQTSWGYMDTKHPDQSLCYPNIVYIAFSNKDLGDSDSVPNLSFEVVSKGSIPVQSVFTIQDAPASFDWRGISSCPNGDVYACVYGGGIYKQTGGAGTFTIQDALTKYWRTIASCPNGDVYACASGSIYSGDTGGIYKQTGGTGTFTIQDAPTFQPWWDITSCPNGDVYACVWNGGIYKQTGGTGTFTIQDAPNKSWRAMASCPNGDVYACADSSGGIYKQTGGSGTFTIQDAPTNKPWQAITSCPNGDVYATAYNRGIYKQTGGSGTFTIQDAPTGLDWWPITSCPNGDVYVCADGGGIYKQSGGSGTFTIQNAPNKSWQSMGSCPNGDVYASTWATGIYKGLDVIIVGDENPAWIIAKICTDTKHGAGISVPLSLSDYSNYCAAADFLLSPVYNQQKPLYEHIKDLCSITNSEIVWHDGSVLSIVPYGDTTITGNGVTWVPNVTPIYSLTDDDYICDNDDDPVKIIRLSRADIFNDVKVEFVNRSNDYNVEIAQAKDQTDIEIHGLRADATKQAHQITRSSVAASISQTILQRGLYIRNNYEFTLGWKYCLLEPMDIITITDSRLGLDACPVRVIRISENENGDLTITAEDFPAGVGSTVQYPTQPTGGYVPMNNVDPGNVNTPVIFDAPGILTDSGSEIWGAVSGGINWGGCDIWASLDGISYSIVGRVEGGARHGQTTDILPSHVDPDTVNACKTDLTISRSELLSGTQADADNLVTLCLVGNAELIAYETATLTAEYHYDLTYLRRGAYNSIIAEHPANARFVRLDSGVFHFPRESNIKNGDIVYLKFQSFNIYHGALQSIDALDVYQFVAGNSLSYPSVITGFRASQNDHTIMFSWNYINEKNISTYEIRYAVKGDYVWENGTPIAIVSAGTTAASVYASHGHWTFSIRAKDSAGNYSRESATYDLDVRNDNEVIYASSQAAIGWPGPLSYLVKHWTNVLTPMSQGVAADDGWDTFDKYVPNPYQIGEYEAPEISLGIDTTVNASGIITSTLGPGETVGVADPALLMKWRTIADPYNDYTTWSTGELLLSACFMKLQNDASIGIVRISDFVPTLDVPPF
jgi:hypothetical protein